MSHVGIAQTWVAANFVDVGFVNFQTGYPDYAIGSGADTYECRGSFGLEFTFNHSNVANGSIIDWDDVDYFKVGLSTKYGFGHDIDTYSFLVQKSEMFHGSYHAYSKSFPSTLITDIATWHGGTTSITLEVSVIIQHSKRYKYQGVGVWDYALPSQLKKLNLCNLAEDSDGDTVIYVEDNCPAISNTN